MIKTTYFKKKMIKTKRKWMISIKKKPKIIPLYLTRLKKDKRKIKRRLQIFKILYINISKIQVLYFF